MQILESGMKFGDYKQERVFKIENSFLHRQAGLSVKSVEFVLLNGKDKFFFIEAKSSSPKKGTNNQRYQEFLAEITEKFIHSFDMLCAWYLKRVEDEGQIGEEFKNVTFSNAKFVFVLAIHGHKDSWLLPLQEELKLKLRYHTSIWKSQVVVMNEDIAKKYRLIV